MTSFTPLSREKLRTLRSLSSAKIRKRKGICLVEGERALEEASRSGSLVYLVLSVEEAVDNVTVILIERFPGVPVYSLEDSYFSELTDVVSGTGILGVARIPHGGRLEEIKSLPADTVMLYLDGLEDPGNVGGIIRTAWALGVSGVMLSKGTADPFGAKSIRSSAGGIFHIPVFYSIGIGSLKDLQENGYSIYLAEADGADIEGVRFSARSILALGSETHGLSGMIRKMGQPVGITMAPGVNSLNVVVAGSIILEKMIKSQ